MATISAALELARWHWGQGRLDAVELICRKILEVEPGEAAAWQLRAEAALAAHQPAAAEAFARQTLALAPQNAEAHFVLAGALEALERGDEAPAAYQTCVTLRPDHVAAWSNWGLLLHEAGQLAEAEACYRRAIEIAPAIGELYCNLANLLKDQKRRGEAEATYRRALQLKPGWLYALNNFGTFLHQEGRFAEAEAVLRESLQQGAERFEPLVNLANLWKDAGLIEQALPAYRQAADRSPPTSHFAGEYLLALQYDPAITPQRLHAAHAQWGQQAVSAAATAPAVPFPVTARDDERLRLGFVSADLGTHPVGRFLLSTLEGLDRRRCAVVCYSDRPAADALAPRFHAVCDAWHTTHRWSDARLAQHIRDDRIDVLFDLAGHTAHSRLPVFLQRAAPVQVTWIGYEGTTGLPTMDYLLADRFLIGPAEEAHYVERVLRLPDSYVAFTPPAEAPPVAPLPALRHGRITLGSFNNPAKINARVIALWADVLRAVPDARLVLRYRLFADGNVQQRFRAAFAGHGIDPARVEFRGWTDYADLLAAYGEIDVALDPFPFAGGATTCEALWMGVPVVTWPGATFASRHGRSFLSTLGLPQWIVGTAEEYVARARELAGDLEGLATWRAALRPRMAAAPLCDGRRLAEQLLNLLEPLARQRR